MLPAPTPWRRRFGACRDVSLTALLCGVLGASVASSVCAQSLPQVERGFFPDSRPNALVVGFSGGLSVCYDPVRGGLNYAWTGYIDVSPIRPGLGKVIKAAEPLGRVVYRESGDAPIRLGDPRRSPEVRLRGYTLGPDRIEFSYLIDGVEVREEIRPRPGGDGLTRRFRYPVSAGPLWYVTATRDGASVIAPGATPRVDGLRFDAGSGGDVTVDLIWERNL